MKRGTKVVQPLGKTSAQAAVLARVGFLSVLLVALCAGSPTSIAQTRTYDPSIGGTGSKSGEGNGIGGTGEPAAKVPGIGGTGGPAAKAPGIGGTGIIGTISDVENEAQIVSASGSTTAVVGLAVHMKDQLDTGADGRLQVTFKDQTVLTLGENAQVLIDRYVFDPDRGMGEALLHASQGAFRFAAGKLKDVANKKITVSTPVADIGVRGTEFWGGPTDGQYGVLLIEGEVAVINQGGTVTLSHPGEGTEIHSRFESPRPPTKWAPERVSRALGKTVTRHEHNLRNLEHNPRQHDHGPEHNLEHGPGHRSEFEPGPHPNVQGIHPNRRPGPARKGRWHFRFP